MNNRAEELIYDHFIDKFLGKTEQCVGVEIELPVLNLARQPVEPEFSQAMVDLLVHRFQFRPTGFTLEGFPSEAVNDKGDVFSFETSFNTIEFSMGKERSVIEIADRFYPYLRALKELEKSHHHLICGMGTNPYAEYADSKPLHTPALTAKSQFLKKFTTHHDGEIFHAFSAATQTHLDVRLPDLPNRLNLLGKLAFADGILFANSLPFPYGQTGAWKAKLPLSLVQEMGDHTLCFRDTLWRLCEAPNTAAYDQDYRSIEDVAGHLMDLKIFLVSDGNDGFRPIRPVKFSDYFQDQDKPEQDVLCFRSLEPIAVSKHGTIEIRHTCTQPLSEIFIPTAFYTGISENYGEAAELVQEFWRENKIAMTNSELRCQAVHQGRIAPPENMHYFMKNLVTISWEGLKKRNFGEEKYLAHLIQADDLMECPAKRQLRLLQEGLTYQEIILAYSAVDTCKN
ncbi:hypothetical protein [Candidatus Formimonas warabiya]|uniref:Glutamate--cysteine ligase n=1 Tax=Formimonas warabiya TaxID=1761012 RepID=A0A3G1KMG8_FORW1|nr:hypothetical protein [Candidatus Formimonas warabiya]ATW23619.1 hypothetical protein DCMF_01325 [Candidatus Formimonas warabiya]